RTDRKPLVFGSALDPDGMRASAGVPGSVDGPSAFDAYNYREQGDATGAVVGRTGQGASQVVHVPDNTRVVDTSSTHGDESRGTGRPNMSDPGESLTLTSRADRYAVFDDTPATFKRTHVSNTEGDGDEWAAADEANALVGRAVNGLPGNVTAIN